MEGDTDEERHQVSFLYKATAEILCQNRTTTAMTEKKKNKNKRKRKEYEKMADFSESVRVMAG